jgi:4-aminobutyrate aminotransferase-like enzyme
MRDRGILIGVDGPDHNVLKIRPPLPFSINDANILVEQLEQCFMEVAIS